MRTDGFDLRDRGDAALVSASRSGDLDAFMELADRHLPAMRRLARILDPMHLCGDLSGPALAIAYPSALQGRAPAMALRSYLLLLVRNLHRVRCSGLVSPFLGEEPVFTARPFADHSLHPGPHQPTVAAFALLPDAWQAALWHLEVEHDSPARVGRLLGIPADSVPALAARARAGLPDGALGPALAGHLLGEYGEEYVTLARAGASVPRQRHRHRAPEPGRCTTRRSQRHRHH